MKRKELENLERRLRADALTRRRLPSVGLRLRTLAGLGEREIVLSPRGAGESASTRRSHALAAAALACALLAALFRGGSAPPREEPLPPSEPRVVDAGASAPDSDALGGGAPERGAHSGSRLEHLALRLAAATEEPLWSEGAHLFGDGARLAEGILRRIPPAIRARVGG